MKRGFTLAEVLITLGIIGIVSALIIPAANSLKPDKNKAMYLQTYDTISSTIKELAANSRLYPVCKSPNAEDNVSCSQFPLVNTSRPLDNKYNNARYEGDRKLCSLMALSLGVDESDMSCNAGTYAFNSADFTNKFSNPSFTTKNGMRWRIVPQIATFTSNFEARFQHDIYVDIDPTNNNVDGEDKSCIFDEDDCKQPDIFKFLVGADGKVVPADPLGRLYISGRKSLIKKDLKEDAFDGNNVITANLPTGDRVFLYSKCNGEQGTPCAEDETMTIGDNGITCTPIATTPGVNWSESVIVTLSPCYIESLVKCPVNVQSTSGLTHLSILRTWGISGTVASSLATSGMTILEGSHDFITITGYFSSGVTLTCTVTNNTCSVSEKQGDVLYSIRLINNSEGWF